MSDSKLRGDKIWRVLRWKLSSFPDHEVPVSCTEEFFLLLLVFRKFTLTVVDEL